MTFLIYWYLLPTISEQQKIAAILSSVDEAIEKTEQIIDQTEKVKKGLMQQLLTKGIGHTKFKKTAFGEIPEEWQVNILENVVDFTNGKAHEKFIDETGDYIVVNSKFISSDGKNYKQTNKRVPPLVIGDIVMVMSDVPKGKALAKCFYVNENNKYTLNQRICKLRGKNLNNEFLYYYLNRNQYFISFDNGVGQTNLRRQEVLECPIVIPSLEEQKNIVDILNIYNESLKKTKLKLDVLNKIKQGLMQSLLTGKVRVPIDDEEVV